MTWQSDACTVHVPLLEPIRPGCFTLLTYPSDFSNSSSSIGISSQTSVNMLRSSVSACVHRPPNSGCGIVG